MAWAKSPSTPEEIYQTKPHRTNNWSCTDGALTCTCRLDLTAALQEACTFLHALSNGAKTPHQLDSIHGSNVSNGSIGSLNWLHFGFILAPLWALFFCGVWMHMAPLCLQRNHWLFALSICSTCWLHERGFWLLASFQWCHSPKWSLFFPWGVSLPPGQSMSMHGRTPSRFATVEGKAEQLSAPSLLGSLTNRTASGKGRMHKNPKFYRHSV